MSFLIFQMLMLSSACLLDFSSSAMLPPAPQSAAPAHGLARRQSSATSRRLHSKSGKSASPASRGLQGPNSQAGRLGYSDYVRCPDARCSLQCSPLAHLRKSVTTQVPRTGTVQQSNLRQHVCVTTSRQASRGQAGNGPRGWTCVDGWSVRPVERCCAHCMLMLCGPVWWVPSGMHTPCGCCVDVNVDDRMKVTVLDQ